MEAAVATVFTKFGTSPLSDAHWSQSVSSGSVFAE
jgi:hypothetical protein